MTQSVKLNSVQHHRAEWFADSFTSVFQMTDLSALWPGTGKSHQALSGLTAEQSVAPHWSEADIPSTIGKTIYEVILKTSATPQRNSFQALVDITQPVKP